VNQRERYRAEAQVKAAELAAELEKAWGRYLAVTGRLREDSALD